MAHILTFACLSFSTKICMETHRSVEHLWIKMCNFHHNVLTVEDLPFFNTANCVLQMCWRNILCGSQQGMKCILAIDITFLVFLCCQSLHMVKALREQRQAERRRWDEGNYGELSKKRKTLYLYSTSYQTASGKMCVWVSFNLVSAAEQFCLFNHHEIVIS